MSEEQLTVEKIKAGKDGTGKNAGMFVTGNEAWLHQEAIDLLLSKLATIERDTAEKCAKISENIVGNGCDFIEDVIAEGIRDHFNNKEDV